MGLAAAAARASLYVLHLEAQSVDIELPRAPSLGSPAGDDGRVRRQALEVMASAADLPTALAKAERAAGRPLPTSGTAFLSVRDEDKPAVVAAARTLERVGYTILATPGTHRTLKAAGIAALRETSLDPKSPLNLYQFITTGQVALVINTTQGTKAIADSYSIRRNALLANIPYFTTLSAGLAAVDALEVRGLLTSAQVRSLQEWHARSG